MDPETGEGGWRDAIDKEECEKPIEDSIKTRKSYFIKRFGV